MNNIQKRVLDKLKVNFSVQLEEELYDTSFFNPKVGLAARHLIDLVFEIENEFSVKFDEKCLINPEFVTFNGFVKEIQERVNS